ncbi:MAG: hypothetical protein QXO51_07390 [Halobacteria archaeon]
MERTVAGAAARWLPAVNLRSGTFCCRDSPLILCDGWLSFPTCRDGLEAGAEKRLQAR